MKKKKLFLLSATMMVFSLHLLAQTNEETRTLQEFNGVKVSHSIEAELVKGEKHEVKITSSGLELEKIDTKIIDKTLQVSATGRNFSAAAIKVIVTFVEINEVTASSSSKVFIKELLSANEVKISASTASYIEVKVKAQNLLLHADTKAKIFIDGTAENLELEAYTTAEINGERLEVESAQIKINTAARANFIVHESLKGSAATAGKAYYTGEPKVVDLKTNTGGVIEKKNQ